jgi:hypothetical protein
MPRLTRRGQPWRRRPSTCRATRAVVPPRVPSCCCARQRPLRAAAAASSARSPLPQAPLVHTTTWSAPAVLPPAQHAVPAALCPPRAAARARHGHLRLLALSRLQLLLLLTRSRRLPGGLLQCSWWLPHSALRRHRHVPAQCDWRARRAQPVRRTGQAAHAGQRPPRMRGVLAS